jgi:Uma2 family endonuclease
MFDTIVYPTAPAKQKIKISPFMSDDEFFDFCQANKSKRIERTKNREIIIMEPVGGESGYVEGESLGQLHSWNRSYRKGLVFSPSTGFTLPSGAVKSADAAWLRLETWAEIPLKDRKRFAHVSPDFIIEIRSETDSLTDLLEKMTEWIENGVRLGWLIDPKQKKSYIFRANGSVDEIDGFDKILTGENVLEGFELNLSDLELPV